MSARPPAFPPAAGRPAGALSGSATRGRRSRGGRRWPVLAAVLVALLVAAIVIRALTLTPAPVAVATTHAPSVRLSGAAPKPDWPTTGQAALAVEGIGALGSSGGQTPRPIASVAKVMTAYLILQRHPLRPSDSGFTLTVSRAQARSEARDAREGQSVVAVAAGERLDERQLLEALLIGSGDNIARMLAAHQAGSVAGFVAQMNRQARSLGMDDTTYTDPSGLAASTVSTASDQLRLLQRAIRLPTFRRTVSMASVTLPVAGIVANYDPLIADGYDGKTGSDSAAEGCLAFFKQTTVGGRRLTTVGVVLGQGEGSATSVILGAAGDAAQNLVASVLPAIRVHTVLPAHTAVMAATGADGHRVHAVTARPLQAIGWGGLRERIRLRARRLGSSLDAGQRIGQASLAGGLPLPAGATRHTEVRAAGRLPAPGFGWRLTHLF